MSETVTTLTYQEGAFAMKTLAGHLKLPATLASNGLAYHPTLNAKAMEIFWLNPTGQKTEYFSQWTVSHVGSGSSLCSKKAAPFASEEQCRAFIERAHEVVDWTLEKPVLTPKIVERLYAIRQEVEAG